MRRKSTLAFVILVIGVLLTALKAPGVSALPLGEYGRIAALGFKGPDIWSLTAAPDRRIYGITGAYPAHLFYWYANCTDLNGVLCNLGTLAPINMTGYALTTAPFCVNRTSIDHDYWMASARSAYVIWIGGGPEAYDGNGGHLLRYLPYKHICDDPWWSPGPGILNNPRDYGAVYTITGWTAPIPTTPGYAQIYQLATGPCCKIYGGLGYDIRGDGVLNRDAATFFVFDPITETITFTANFPGNNSVFRVSTGRDGRVYFIVQDLGAMASWLYRYEPLLGAVQGPILSSAGLNVGIFTCLTWSFDGDGNPRIYLGTSMGHLISVDPNPPYPTNNFSILGPVVPTGLYIWCLTTGMFDIIYGGGSDGTNAYFFVYETCCKGWNPGWSSSGWANPATFPAIPGESRIRSICYGQESRHGGSVNNKDPRVYFGTGLTATATNLYAYSALTPDLNRDCKVDIKDIARASKQFGADPPEGASGQSEWGIWNPIAMAAIASASSIPLITLRYRMKRANRNNGQRHLG